jgi:small GTP-binding protein
MSYKTITEFDHIFRVLFVGDDSVGKTSLLQRYVENTFSDIYMPTIGIDFKINTVKFNKKVTLTSSRCPEDVSPLGASAESRGLMTTGYKVIKLQLYDTGGGDQFRHIVSAYYPNTDAIVIVYDISNIDSFHHVERWLHDVHKNQNVPTFLIGNKTDLPSYRRVVSSVAGETLARQHGMIFFETSAKNKIQSSYLPPQIPVEKVFVEICKECLVNKPPSESGPLLASFESTVKEGPSMKAYNKYCFFC